jgi:hypothetical protein
VITWDNYITDDDAGTARYAFDWYDDHAAPMLTDDDDIADALAGALSLLDALGDPQPMPEDPAASRDLADVLRDWSGSLLARSEDADDDAEELRVLRLARAARDYAGRVRITEDDETLRAEWAYDDALGAALEMLAAWGVHHGPAVLDDGGDGHLCHDVAAYVARYIRARGAGDRWEIVAGPGWARFAGWGYDAAPDLTINAPANDVARDLFRVLVADAEDADAYPDYAEILETANALAALEIAEGVTQ